MKRFPDKRIFILACLNATLYVPVVVIDTLRAVYHVAPALGLACDAFKYSAIISCLLICVFAFSDSGARTPRLQTIVFCFTLAADFFLLFTPYFAAGVFAFLGAHLCALIRYKPRRALPTGLCAAAAFVLVLLLTTRGLRLDAGLSLVASVCVAYAILIISVTVSTFYAPQPRVNTLFSRVGMCLFLACDINVAIFNAMPAGLPLHTASIVLMWFFYLPAQTLLALSACNWDTEMRQSHAEIGNKP